MLVKILGAGCPKCHQLAAHTNEAIEILDIEAELEFVTDMDTILSYGVMSTPAIIVNDQVLSVGKVLDTKSIIKLFESII